MRILCLVPALPGEPVSSTLRSISKQDVDIQKIIVISKYGDQRLRFNARISKILNFGLADVKLSEFDYILRVDIDTILPENFVSGNLKLNADVVGMGYAQLVKVKPFIACMGGKFHYGHDDGYIHHKFRMCGFKSSGDYAVNPIRLRESGNHNGASWFLDQGYCAYQLGFYPLYWLSLFYRRFSKYIIFEFFGYVNAWIHRAEKFDVAEWNMYRQLNKFRSIGRLFKVIKNYCEVIA